MKNTQIFWGLLLITLGSLVLMNKYDLIDTDWSFVFNLWPLIFIFWGAMVIWKNAKFKPIITGLFGVLTGLLIFAVFSGFWWHGNFNNCDDDYDKNYSSESVSHPYDPAIKYAELEINGGAGRIYISGDAAELIESSSSGIFSDYSFYKDEEDDRLKARFNMEEYGSVWPFSKKNRLRIKLHKEPIWDIEVNSGATKSELDLSELKVAEVEINTGASGTYIKLGDKQAETNVNVSMGAAGLKIEIPENVGCKITGEMVLISKKLKNFIKKGSDYYVSPNYETAKKFININVEGGVGSFRLIRY